MKYLMNITTCSTTKNTTQLTMPIAPQMNPPVKQLDPLAFFACANYLNKKAQMQKGHRW